MKEGYNWDWDSIGKTIYVIKIRIKVCQGYIYITNFNSHEIDHYDMFDHFNHYNYFKIIDTRL